MEITPNFIKINDISKHLYCSVCMEIFKIPMRPICGHTFCLECI